MKKLKIFILTLLMVITVLPVNTIAEGEQTTAPDVTVYATKDDMMGETFAPNSNGTAKNIGKILFGKNSSGNSQEWYILGADSGVNDGKNNTIIFATSPIVATGQVFEDAPNNKTDSSLWSDCDYNGVNVTEVYRNHYGASDLRVALQNMAANTSYFTTAEQGLMNPTTVTTNDTYNKDDSYNYLTYTTTDKLYALMADDYGSSYKTIKAGSDNSTVISMSSYWSSGTWFWLRSPEINSGGMALVAYPGNHVCEFSVIIGSAVQPASNLNLTNVLFASAAQAGTTDKIEDGTAMTLRLDGAKQEYINEFGTIGTVVYDSTNGIIKATKGSTDKAVTLVVQGKNGDNWYYSQTVDNTFAISVDDIENVLNIANVNLNNCKIWLEISDDNVSYAVEASSASISTITSVDIKEIDAPKANTELDITASCDTIGVDNTKPSVKWNSDSVKADYYAQYTASVELIADMAHIFADTVSATINSIGENVIVVKNSNGTLTVSYTFPKTNDKLVSATNPDPITVENGTALEDMKLPETVTVETVGKSVNSLEVKWILDQITDYDPSKKELQEFTIQGTVELPKDNSILPISNDGPATVKIQVTVKAVEIIPTPTPVPPSSSNNNPITGNTTDDGYVVPNTGVK